MGDCKLSGIAALPDPCPLPSATKKRGLREKEKLLYAPMSDVGEMLYDKDAVYINIHDHQVQFSKPTVGNEKENTGQNGITLLCSFSFAWVLSLEGHTSPNMHYFDVMNRDQRRCWRNNGQESASNKIFT